MRVLGDTKTSRTFVISHRLYTLAFHIPFIFYTLHLRCSKKSLLRDPHFNIYLGHTISELAYYLGQIAGTGT